MIRFQSVPYYLFTICEKGWLTSIQVIVFPLHQDYLITQSKLFRLLLSSTPPHLDMPIPSPEHPIPSSTSPFTRRPTAVLEGDPDPSKPLPEGALKGAKIMPTARGEHPAIYVPLPDPGSLGVIIHWLYWYVPSLPPPGCTS